MMSAPSQLTPSQLRPEPSLAPPPMDDLHLDNPQPDIPQIDIPLAQKGGPVKMKAAAIAAADGRPRNVKTQAAKQARNAAAKQAVTLAEIAGPDRETPLNAAVKSAVKTA